MARNLEKNEEEEEFGMGRRLYLPILYRDVGVLVRNGHPKRRIKGVLWSQLGCGKRGGGEKTRKIEVLPSTTRYCAVRARQGTLAAI